MITTELQNKMIQKAKTKSDGVYSMSPYKYLVRDGRLVAFCHTVYKEIYSFHGIGNMSRGKVEYAMDIPKELKKIK